MLSSTKVSGGYAPLGHFEPVPCRPGTFAYSDGLQYPWQCRLCPPTMMCPAGYPERVDRRGRVTTNPGASGEGDFEICPTSHICQPGTFPNFCPLGSFLKSTRSADVTVRYLNEYDQTFNGSVEFISDKFCQTCPVGHFCQILAQEKTKCPEGSYNKYQNQTRCITCDRGLGEDCRAGNDVTDRLAAKCYDQETIQYSIYHRYHRFIFDRYTHVRCIPDSIGPIHILYIQ